MSNELPAFCDGVQAKRRTRVLWIWHAAVVAEYQKPLAELARCPDLDVTLLVPRRWPERAGRNVKAETLEGANFGLIKSLTLFTGFYYIYFFPNLIYHLFRVRPDIIYCYEEPHTLMAALVLLLRRLFFPRVDVFLYAAQNIRKRYPLPFRMFESYAFRNASAIIACGHTVARTLRSKGYGGTLHIVALPTDTQAFRPSGDERNVFRVRSGISVDGATVIGYAGKLVEEKGLRALFSAFGTLAQERPDVYLLLAGDGPLRKELEHTAEAYGDRARSLGVVHNSDLPMFMNALDVFVLPSESRGNWREQFGRVAVEAMACGVTVVGSNSGEIPHVVAGAGLTFPEGNADDLLTILRLLCEDANLRSELGQKGRRRVLDRYSIEGIAAQHYGLYKRRSTPV